MSAGFNSERSNIPGHYDKNVHVHVHEDEGTMDTRATANIQQTQRNVAGEGKPPEKAENKENKIATNGKAAEEEGGRERGNPIADSTAAPARNLSVVVTPPRPAQQQHQHGLQRLEMEQDCGA